MSSGEEFTDYLASIARAEATEAARQESILRHQHWQQTTILGKLTSFIVSLSRSSFFENVADAFRDQQQGTSLNAIILFNVVRICLIFMAVLAVFVIGKVIQRIIGDEIVVEEVIEIVEEIPRSSLNKKERRSAKTKTKTKTKKED